MRILNEEIRNNLVEKMGVNPDKLSFLAGGREDSDGIVYTANDAGKNKVVKISQASDEEHVKNILEFAYFLGLKGINVGTPLPNRYGRIYETAYNNEDLYICTVMDFIEGQNPDNNRLMNDDKLVYEWGKLTGRMHKAAKDYPVWKNVDTADERYGYECEIDYFLKKSANDFIREKWISVKERMSKLPINRDTYGFIHNDNHQMNIITANDEIAVIDFDCAECHFFINDILLPVQGLLFDVAGGMLSPLEKPEILKKFYASFMEGYRTENELDDFWLEQLGLFLEYRRLLLYCVLQGWLSQDKNANEAFVEMIKNPCEILLK